MYGFWREKREGKQSDTSNIEITDVTFHTWQFLFNQGEMFYIIDCSSGRYLLNSIGLIQLKGLAAPPKNPSCLGRSTLCFYLGNLCHTSLAKKTMDTSLIKITLSLYQVFKGIFHLWLLYSQLSNLSLTSCFSCNYISCSDYSAL